MGDTVDAVVIGAGHNGLVAANMLADAGVDVVVLEATEEPGGAVRSAELTAPGYRSDLCSAFYPLAGAGSPLGALGLEDYGLAWAHAPAVLGHPLDDGRAVVLSRDLATTAASVSAFAASDGAAWQRLYGQWRHLSTAVLGSLLAPFPPVRGGAAMLRRAGAAEALRLARMFLQPVRVFGDERFAGEGAKLLLTGCTMHTDLSPDDAGGAPFGWLLAMLGQDRGFPVPVGGAQRITDALVARLRDRGGQVLCHRRVDRVVVAGGRALGVRCVDGSLWRARRGVLADVPAPALYLDLVGLDRLPDQVRSRLAADLAAFRWDSATVKLDWALSGPVPWTNPALADAGTLHLGGDLTALTRYATDLVAGDVPARPFVLAGQMTTADPTRSPAGTESMWAYTHLPRRPQWTAAEVAGHAERVEDTVERYAPGFRDRIVGRHVTGPNALQRHNPSLVGGAINGGTAAVFQQLVFRPIPGLGRADTPVDRLFLAGSGAHPGGGVHGAPGANAARALLARWHPLLGGAYRAAIRAAHDIVYRV